MKSERLKKLEKEIKDLEKWLSLDLVPKKDLEKHKIEISALRSKIEEEKQRLDFLKENGDLDDFVMPKRSQQKQIYDPQSIPDIDFEGGDVSTSDASGSDSNYDMESSSFEPDHTTLFDIEMAGEEKATSEYDTDEDPYSDKNRWKRSTEITDPEHDDW